MNSHDWHAQRLLLASRDCGQYVYRLRVLGARDLANRLSSLGMQCMALAARYRHLSVQTYKRRADKLIAAYTAALADALQRYPVIAQEIDYRRGLLSPIRSRRILIRLRADQWTHIDNLIKRKEFRTIGDYFGYLFQQLRGR